MFTLITGGARSGKSCIAQKFASGRVAFVATAEAGDEEMEMRIRTHKASRPCGWVTVEEPLAPRSVLEHENCDSYIIDCITLLVTNLTLAELPEDVRVLDAASRTKAENRVLGEIRELAKYASSCDKNIIAVTNEIGAGIVPTTPLGRLVRDLQGTANRILAAAADSVILMVCGIPLQIKPDLRTLSL